MDHQAFAAMLGNYGEFLGSVAVLATLLYLAAQIRQNSALAKAELETKGLEAYSRARSLTSQHPEVFAKVRAGGELSDVDIVIRDNLASEMLFASAICFQSSKLTDPDGTDRFVSSAVGFLRRYDLTLGEHEVILRSGGYEEFVDKVQFRLTTLGS